MNDTINNLKKSYWVYLIISIGMSGCSLHPARIQLDGIDERSMKEIVVFCGNPGVGKSSLLNTIFEENVFKSGVTGGGGLTKNMQEHIYKEIEFIDTPGLSDSDFQGRAAIEIEKTLRKNGKYKIFFVLTLEAGRFRSNDLLTINKVCEAIKVDFEYGVILNKITPKIRSLIEERGEMFFSNAFSLLHKQPISKILISYDASIYDCNDVYLTHNAQDRTNLLTFISDLPGAVIMDDQVVDIDVIDYAKKNKELDGEIAFLRKQIQLSNENKALQMLGGTLGTVTGSMVAGPMLQIAPINMGMLGGTVGAVAGPSFKALIGGSLFGNKILEKMGDMVGSIQDRLVSIGSNLPYANVSESLEHRPGSVGKTGNVVENVQEKMQDMQASFALILSDTTVGSSLECKPRSNEN